MVIVEFKLFISIILPLATILIIVKGDARKILSFLLFGIIAEMASNLIQNYLSIYIADDLYFTANIAPFIEEILKALPVLIFIFAFKPDKQLIYEVGIASGIGFAILENAFILSADIYDTSLGIAFLRGIGSGMMHAVCTLAIAYGMSFIYKKRWFFVPGTFVFLFMAMVYHSIFNTLVQSPFQIIGLLIPIATFIPLIIRIMGTEKGSASANRKWSILSLQNLSAPQKNLVRAGTCFLVITIFVVSIVGVDGSRLTGGKNGIYGLSNNGIDVEAQVKSALASHQQEYDKIYKENVKNEWLKEKYVDVYNQIAEFSRSIQREYQRDAAFAPMKAKSSDTNIVTATASIDALPTTHTVVVEQLAVKANEGAGVSNDSEQESKDAIVIIDGKTYNNNSNELEVNGIKYFLRGVNSRNNYAQITIFMDNDTIFQNLKSFIQDYNKLVEYLTFLYKEDVYSGYDVLTQEQEAEMSEEEIANWNNKAKSGLLAQNRTLGIFLTNIRESFYSNIKSVDGEFQTTSSIGLALDSMTGLLDIDNSKLNTALQKDTLAVHKLFNCNNTDVTDYDYQDVLSRLYNYASNTMTEIKNYAGTTYEPCDSSALGVQIFNLKNKMERIEELMEEYKNKLNKKYESMQDALQKLQELAQSLGL